MQYPNGKLCDDDEGALEIAISEGPGIIKIDFGTNLRWIALQPEQAREIGTRLLQFAHQEETQYEG